MSEAAEIVVPAVIQEPAPATALAVVQESPTPSLDRIEILSQELSLMDGMWQIAEKIARTPFGAAHGHQTENVFGAMMKGYEVGLQPMQSLDSIDVIQGKPTLKPETMRALIRSHGHDFEVVEQTDQQCVMLAHRKEWPADKWTRWEFTWQHAIDMKLDKKDNWLKQRAVMLFSRCTSKMGRGEFADVLKGLSYTPDEIRESIVVEARPVETPREITESGPRELQSQLDRDLLEIRRLLAALNKPQKDELKAWWKSQDGYPTEGKWPAGLMSQIDETQATEVIAECKRIASTAPALREQSEGKSPTPTAHQLLDIIWVEREVHHQSDQKNVTGLILNRVVKDIAKDISDDEARMVADTVESMTDDDLKALILEAQ